MAKSTPGLLSLFHVALPKSFPDLLKWNYVPRTQWFTHFVTINNNVNDAPIEEHVLGDVGSYGMQLGEILDALEVLIKLIKGPDRNTLTNAEIGKLADVSELHARVNAAVAEFRKNPTV